MTELDSLKKKISEDPASFIILLGAGASIPAGLPSWSGLRDILCDSISEIKDDTDEVAAAIKDVKTARDMWISFSKLRTILGSQIYEKKIIESLDPKNLKTPSIYQKLWLLNPAGIIDFNLDKLAINSYSELHHTAVDYASSKEPHKFKNYPSTDERFVFFPHGIVSDSNSWVFTAHECKSMYQNHDFRMVMGSLLNSKNLLIIGFNPDEWNFLQLLCDIGITGKISGYHNYYLCPNADSDRKKRLGDVGISVISYHPVSKEHSELLDILESILSYDSMDEAIPSVYLGKKYTESDIPSVSDCYKIGIDELRNILNGVVANIISAESSPTDEQMKNLERFYNTYIPQIHRAWLVDPRSPDTNKLYNYKIIRNIGNGAFGSVYEAEDEIGNRYAVKVLLQAVKDETNYLSCFRRGIRSMRILTKQNIPGMVKIHASYEVPACIVMDMVDGSTLRDVIEKRLLTDLSVKLIILKRIASIIREAHQLEERILHRDLKPENIMLEFGYSASDFSNPNDIPQIKILDFDLSWHRGATEKTINFGAISQGFMAPEQVDANADREIARSTAVDVYSMGMLVYYTLTATNPLPNEPRFASFSEKVLAALNSSNRFQWKCLPFFLRDTIIKATYENQLSRISMDSLIQNIDLAKEMHLHNTIPNTHPLVLMELRQRIDNMGEDEITDFGRTITIKYPSLAKTVILSTSSTKNKVILNVVIERVAQSSDARDGISKYFKTMQERAIAANQTEYFDFCNGEYSVSMVRILMSTELPETITLDYIDALAKNIQKVRFELTK